MEILDAEHTDRHWRWFNTGFALAVPVTWFGEVEYRRRRLPVQPGMVFCSAPGEVHTTPRVRDAGTFHAMIIEPDLFRDYATEHGLRSRRPEWGSVVETMSVAMRTRMQTFIRSLGPDADPMQLQSSLVELFETMVPELVEGGAARPAAGVSHNTVERIRECLHDDDERTDLEALARRFELSRFQVLREFKRHYGVPPHSYQLCRRIGLAREMLKSGKKPAQVAADCGFSDQSHLGRHFKRMVGVSPGQYVQSCFQPRTSDGPDQRWRVIARTLQRRDPT